MWLAIDHINKVSNKQTDRLPVSVHLYASNEEVLGLQPIAEEALPSAGDKTSGDFTDMIIDVPTV